MSKLDEQLKKFEGCYRINQITPTGTNIKKVKITSTIDDKLPSDKTATIFVTNFDDGHVINFYKIPQTSFIRYDGALVSEWSTENKNGTVQKNADVLKMKHDNNFVKNCHRNYSFKDLFGGYWFANDTNKYNWTKISCDKD